MRRHPRDGFRPNCAECFLVDDDNKRKSFEKLQYDGLKSPRAKGEIVWATACVTRFDYSNGVITVSMSIELPEVYTRVVNLTYIFILSNAFA
jgi:hypothetical protein